MTSCRFLISSQCCVHSKFLGVQVNGSLTWEKHVDYLTGNTTQCLCCDSYAHIDSMVLKSVYYAYVLSLQSYCIIFWGMVMIVVEFTWFREEWKVMANSKGRERCKSHLGHLIYVLCSYLICHPFLFIHPCFVFKRILEILFIEIIFMFIKHEIMLFSSARLTEQPSMKIPPNYALIRWDNNLPNNIKPEILHSKLKNILYTFLMDNAFYNIS